MSTPRQVEHCWGKKITLLTLHYILIISNLPLAPNVAPKSNYVSLIRSFFYSTRSMYLFKIPKPFFSLTFSWRPCLKLYAESRSFKKPTHVFPPGTLQTFLNLFPSSLCLLLLLKANCSYFPSIESFNFATSILLNSIGIFLSSSLSQHFLFSSWELLWSSYNFLLP